MNYSPILIPAPSMLTPANPGEIVRMQEGLKNPDSAPMLLDEIRVSTPFWWNGLKMRAYIGREPITDDFVAMPLMCESRDWFANMTNHRFILPHPVVLPGRAITTLEFTIEDPWGAVVFPTTQYPLEAALVGRALPKETVLKPTTRVPWVTSWVTDILQPGGVSSTVSLLQRSTVSDLKNPHNVPLNLHRMQAYVASGASITAALSGAPLPPLQDDLAMKYATVRLATRTGPLGVRDATPVGSLINYGQFSWVWKTVMPARGYYIAEASMKITVDSHRDGPGASRVEMALVGDREVNTGDLEVKHA